MSARVLSRSSRAVLPVSPRPIGKLTGKVNRSHASTDSSPPVEGAAAPTPTDEAFDFSTLEANILKAIEKLTHDLSQLRAGGRFNPEKLESLRVTLVKGSKETVRLSDIAQVVPRGRTISIIAGEAEHLKPLTSAIASSPYNLTPQPSPDSPTTLLVTVPPPTGESRQQALDAAHKAAETANLAVKNARAAHQKKLRSLEKARKVRPDDLQKAHKEMEAVVKRGGEEVKRITEGARRVLEG
ncbi:ribosome-recycling factor [Coniosporium tulheliwenetii]|uniref:Ribosome-recycling factor n=1 Tax=Coniosporium tulheliwenetii TaxID=3383036 RepID=A0ACC2YJ17_9PEZI|nr:ribosome-recycling factor [Cladosporium sp. JES 115]